MKLTSINENILYEFYVSVEKINEYTFVIIQTKLSDIPMICKIQIGKMEITDERNEISMKYITNSLEYKNNQSYRLINNNKIKKIIFNENDMSQFSCDFEYV